MQLGHLEKLARIRLEDVLVEEGMLDREKVEYAQAEQERTGKQLGEILVEQEILQEYDLAKIVVTHYPLPFLDLAGYTTRREVMQLLPSDFCLKYCVLPLDQFGGTLTLAVCEMPSMEIVEEIVARTKLAPQFFVAGRRVLREALGEGAKAVPGKQTAKRATSGGTAKPAGAAPAAKPAASAPARPAPAATPPAVATTPDGDESESDESGVPFPELLLPRVPMSLAGGSLGAPKAPPPPARPGSRTAVVPRTSPTVVAPPAAATAAGLGWMDSAAKAPPPPTASTPKPSLQKFKFAGGAAKPGETVPDGKGGGAWSSVFDAGEAVVKRETSAGTKPPPQK